MRLITLTKLVHHPRDIYSLLRGFTFVAILSISYRSTLIANITINNKALTHRVSSTECDYEDLLHDLKASSHE